jgi:hypothetical protein
MPRAAVRFPELRRIFAAGQSLKHDPEKWKPVFGKDHAQTIS